MNRILVIDDDKAIVALLEDILVCLGYRVRTAHGGKDGVHIYDREVFDIVITDIVMPNMDGHAVVQHIRNSQRPSTLVLGISGTPWLLEEGDFDYVLAKPFGMHALSKALKEMKDAAFLKEAAS